MGLFSSSYKYVAHAGSSPLFEEDNRPQTLKSNILQSVTSGGFTISDAVRFALGTDMYARSRSMRRYAEKHYVYGLPETDQSTYAVPSSVVQTKIEGELGEPINVRTIQAGNPREDFLLYKEVQANYMNPAYFPWPSGDPLNTVWDESYLKVEIPVDNPAAVVPPDSPYYMADNPPTFYRADIANHLYTVTFQYLDDTSTVQEWEMASTVDLQPYIGKEWVQVRYSRDATPDITEYWTYEIGSGQDPAFEDEIVAGTLAMDYLPIIILMHDRVWFDEAGDPELEETTDRICKRLNLDPYEMKEDYLQQIQDDIDSGDRPKKGLDEWDFFIQFAVPLFAETRGGREYLFHFFQLLEQTQLTFFADYQNFLSAGGAAPYSELVITEGGVNGYNTAYRWSYVHSVTHNGQYTPDGWAEPLLPNRLYSKVYERGETNDAEYRLGIEEVHGPGTPYASYPGKDDASFHHYAVVTLQEQDPDTEVYTYTQVLIMAPAQQYTVNTKEEDTGKAGYRYRYDDLELFPEDPEEVCEMRFPVQIDTIKKVGAIRREEALVEGLCATVYLVEKQEVKWYQSGFFKWLIIIIAVILIVLSILFPGFIAAAAFLMAGALGGGLLTFYIIYTILMFAVGFVISMAGNLIGGTMGTIFAVVGAIVTMQAGLAGAPGGAGWGFSGVGQGGWGGAMSLIQSATPYIKGGMAIYKEYTLDKLQDEMRDFAKTAREKANELQDAWDSMGDMPRGLDPMFLLSTPATIFPTESANQYFSRTLNANPGLIGYDLINNFAEIALTPPENGNDTNIIEAMFDDMAQQRGAA